MPSTIEMRNALEAYWLPFTANRAFMRRPRLITAAVGMHYTTADGRRILDATSGLYCVNAGHACAPIVEAIERSARTVDFVPPFHFAHPSVFELSSRLAQLAPGDLDHVLLANSGSEAVETALKVALSTHRARGEAQRTRFIGRERAYHGVGFGGTSVGGMVNNRRAFGALLPGIDHLPTTYDRKHQAFSIGEPDWGAHLADDLIRLIALHGAETIAAVIVEPVAGSTGCLPPPKGYLERLRAITREHGILLIFDEVITAFGRLGRTFAAERYGIVPDMICFAKGVTNGAVPMSGVIVSRAIYDAHMEGPEHIVELFHGFTYSGHPLAVAAAIATLDVHRDQDLNGRARQLEERLATAMMELRSSPLVVDVRSIGVMCGIDLDPDPAAPGRRGYELMDGAFFDADLYVRVVADTIVVAPPLVATPQDVDDIRNRLLSTLAKLN